MFFRNLRKRKSYDGKVTILALCRFSMGIRIHSFLSSLIFKSYYYVTRSRICISRIWKVFGILSAVTIVEVILGIYKPDALNFSNFMGLSLLN
jgi:hypothetical protein